MGSLPAATHVLFPHLALREHKPLFLCQLKGQRRRFRSQRRGFTPGGLPVIR